MGWRLLGVVALVLTHWAAFSFGIGVGTSPLTRPVGDALETGDYASGAFFVARAATGLALLLAGVWWWLRG